MVDRDPALGYCKGCTRAAELLSGLDRDMPVKPAIANITAALLVRLGEDAVEKNCQGPVPDVALGEPVMKCGLWEDQLTTEDAARMQFDYAVDNLGDTSGF